MIAEGGIAGSVNHALGQKIRSVVGAPIAPSMLQVYRVGA
jgi:hypothetical protein